MMNDSFTSFKDRYRLFGGLFHLASVFQGFVEPNLAEAAAFCLPDENGFDGTVSNICGLPGLRQAAVTEELF